MMKEKMGRKEQRWQEMWWIDAKILGNFRQLSPDLFLIEELEEPKNSWIVKTLQEMCDQRMKWKSWDIEKEKSWSLLNPHHPCTKLLLIIFCNDHSCMMQEEKTRRRGKVLILFNISPLQVYHKNSSDLMSHWTERTFLSYLAFLLLTQVRCPTEFHFFTRENLLTSSEGFCWLL